MPAWAALIVGAWPHTLPVIVLAPLLGMVLAYVLMIAVYWIFRNSTPSKMDLYFRQLQLVSAALTALATAPTMRRRHGHHHRRAGDRRLSEGFPGAGLGHLCGARRHRLGTLSGGWRIVHTMGGRLTRLKPRGGFCAETAARHLDLLFDGHPSAGSTTHVIAGSIAGVGSIHRFKAVRWGIARTSSGRG